MSRQLRLGLTQRVSIDQNTGERRDGLDQRWAGLLGAYDYLVIPLANLLVDPISSVKDLRLDGIVLTGGNDLAFVPNATDPAPERDALESVLLEYAAERKLPVLGVCRGMQMMAKYYGAQVVAVQNHVVPKHSIAAQPGSVIPFGQAEYVNSYHNLGLFRDGLVGDLVACALASDGTVEAITHRQLPHWGIMWHMERGTPSPRDREILTRLFRSTGR
ncbi:MAG: gamma-glutamyl-gamma-aminobutyrate hydrolase family protein [Acidobacteria bacterium]|nr:gamma-glutamyl-gamma-aminobutyrate hydrolase family protein [Acidobacteriota bacterium]